MPARRGVTEARGAPLARVDQLTVEEMGDELLIYDLESDRAHCLSAVAARVWRACDGQTSDAELASKLGIERDEVERALDELADCELLAASAADGLSRRELTVRLATGAAAAAAAPLIVSIVAPTPAAAQTPVEGCEALLTGGCTQNCGEDCQSLPPLRACTCCQLNGITCDPSPVQRSNDVKFCVPAGTACPAPTNTTLCVQPCPDSVSTDQSTLQNKQDPAGPDGTLDTPSNLTQETTTTPTTTTPTTTTPTTTTPETTTSTTPTTPETTTGSSSVTPPAE